MIWRSSYHSKIAQLVDFITALTGFGMGYIILLSVNDLFPEIFHVNIVISSYNIVAITFLSACFVFLFYFQKAYSYQRFTSLLTEYSIIFKVSLKGLLICITLIYMFRLSIPRSYISLAFILIICLYLVQKTLLFYFVAFLRENGRNRRRVIILGTGTRAKHFIETVERHFGWGLDIIGLLTGNLDNVGKEFYGKKVIDVYENIEKVLKEYNPEEVIITISTKRFDKIRVVLESCEKVGINVRLNSDFFGQISKNVKVDNLYGLNIISFGYTQASEFDLLLKRIFDIVVSLIAILLLSPILIIIALTILIQDGRPIFYKWKIVGQHRKPLTSWKFRTMVRNADELKERLLAQNEMTGPMFKITNDPRIIPIGHFLRKYSLDELPQLFSVLIGDLSLVGPRPPLQYEFKDFDLWQRRKLSVKPGLTCLWQISGRSEIKDFDEWAKLDLKYIDNWSIWLDLKIFLKTIPAVLLGRGAK